MKRFRRAQLLLWIVLFATVSCGANILTEFSKRNSNEALFFQAKKLINSGDFSGALTVFDSMPTDLQTNREVKYWWASAYAGLCGVRLLEQLSSFASISSTLGAWTLSVFDDNTTTELTYCESAQALLVSISDAASGRTADENVLAAFVGFGMLGSILAIYADSDDDGTVDAGWDACAAGDLPRVNPPGLIAQKATTSFNFAIDALRGVGSLGTGVVAALTSLCDGLPGGMSLSVCANPPEVVPSNIDLANEKGMRSLLKENSIIGLGANCVGDVTVCNCP